MSIKKNDYIPVKIQQSLEKFHNTMNAWWVSFEQQKKIIEDIKQKIQYNLNPYSELDTSSKIPMHPDAKTLLENESREKRKEFIKWRDDTEITNSLNHLFRSDPLWLLWKIEWLQIDMTSHKKKQDSLSFWESDFMKLLKNKDYERLWRKEESIRTSFRDIYKYIYDQISSSTQEEIIWKLNQHYNAFTQRQHKTSQDILDSEDDAGIHFSHFMYHLDKGSKEARQLMFQLYSPEDNILWRHYKLLLFIIELCEEYNILSKEMVDTIYNIWIIIHQRFDIDPKFRFNLTEWRIKENYKRFFSTIASIIEKVIVKSVKNNYNINFYADTLGYHTWLDLNNYHRQYDKLPIMEDICQILYELRNKKTIPNTYIRKRSDIETLITIGLSIWKDSINQFHHTIQQHIDILQTIQEDEILSERYKAILSEMNSKYIKSFIKLAYSLKDSDKEIQFLIKLTTDILSINKNIDVSSIYSILSQDKIIIDQLISLYRESQKNYIFIEKIYIIESNNPSEFIYHIQQCLSLENKIEWLYRRKINDILLKIDSNSIIDFINTVTSINKKKVKIYISFIELLLLLKNWWKILFNEKFIEYNEMARNNIWKPIDTFKKNIWKYFSNLDLPHLQYIEENIGKEYFIENLKNVIWCDDDHKLLYMYLSKNNQYNQFRMSNYEHINYYDKNLLSTYQYRNKHIQDKLSMINLDLLQEWYQNYDIISWLSEEEIRNNIISSINELYDVDNFENGDKEKILETIEWEELKQYMENKNITEKYKELENNPLYKYHKQLIQQKQLTNDTKNNIEECIKTFLNLLQEIKTYCRGSYNLMEIRIENIVGTINKEMDQDWKINHHDNKDNTVEIFLSTDPIFVATHMRWCLKHKWPSSSHQSSDNVQLDKEWKESIKSFSYYDILVPNCFNIMVRNEQKDIMADQLLYITTLNWEAAILVDTLYGLKNNQILSINIWAIIDRCRDKNIKHIIIPGKTIESVSTTFENLKEQLLHKYYNNIEGHIVSKNKILIDKDLIWYNEVNSSDKHMIINI